MTYSDACVALVKDCEGCRLAAYRCPAGIPTIGYGSTRGVAIGMTITEAEAEARLRYDLDAAAAAVRDAVTVPLTQGQFDALVSFAFNCKGWRASTLIRKLNARDYSGAAAEFPRWVHAAGNKLPGLVERRRREATLFAPGATTSGQSAGPAA